MFGLNKKIFIIGGIGIVVAGVVWYGMTSETPTSLLTTTDVTGASSATERDLIDTLLALRAVTLNGSIFSDRAFLSLQDFGTQIITEPAGRSNPFAPLEPQ
ncbi:hypothetical protein A2673_02320 [Candidatus Kaiserbacteria bacterium RIFCSPHIGHO2_01_FULL_50_13]|uniref:Uncharacterized protein n=1 Tax=Candidatus Kaiserbacteria bacterium RIFCSPLOWO2_01_FULL_50_24 TaxID=1798507 RepID=A0A1F6EQY2_9BACT|nr:MAG: hypothetical protein A2673_02320 [Candidatus Kaiserbacteria bacterium RIFCSPHIGHO2_01_FULL_50_13]OGG76039.1 MAG: hypothetical protein A3A34_00095 [Candidatus Kaiserbacteria bacterium RIFCSPLOWO2_01_FULL_50_24]OGG82045.1 MAG: hypothetical protein A3H74_03510 [Candidatus Kaiserbacteria bacterium RIFCSPLOWO2_02_FULL_51_13]